MDGNKKSVEEFSLEVPLRASKPQSWHIHHSLTFCLETENSRSLARIILVLRGFRVRNLVWLCCDLRGKQVPKYGRYPENQWKVSQIGELRNFLETMIGCSMFFFDCITSIPNVFTCYNNIVLIRRETIRQRGKGSLFPDFFHFRQFSTAAPHAF